MAFAPRKAFSCAAAKEPNPSVTLRVPPPLKRGGSNAEPSPGRLPLKKEPLTRNKATDLLPFSKGRIKEGIKG